MMFIQVKNNTYHVEICGQGFPIVFFHGFTGSTKTWAPIIEKLSQKFTCIAIDLPGHGKTKVTELESMEQACVELVEVLDKLQVNTFHLIGYSMGGRTALVLTSKFPERVKRLILVGASPGLEGEAKIERVQTDEKLANFIKTKGISTFVEYWENIPLFHTHDKLPNDVKKQLRNERLSQNEEGLILSLKTMGTGKQPTIWPKLKNITTPTLLVTGSLDEKFTKINEKMLQLMPNAKHEIVEGVGHAVHLENPIVFGNIVDRFLNVNEMEEI